MRGTVEQRDVEDGAVLPQKPIREKASQQRSEVDAEDEEMENSLGRCLTSSLRGYLILQQPIDQKYRENVAHPVKAETFSSLVSDDERDLRRKPGRERGTWHGKLLSLTGRSSNRLNWRACVSYAKRFAIAIARTPVRSSLMSRAAKSFSLAATRRIPAPKD